MRHNDPFVPRRHQVLAFEQYTPDTFLLKVKSGMDPMPGQFVQASLVGLGECPISIASNSKDHIELLVRKMGAVTSKMMELRKGDFIGLRGPYGHGYPVEGMKAKNLIIIAGGTGIAPPRSVIQYIEKRRKEYGDVHIFLGFRSPEDILFRKDIEGWKKSFDVHLTVDKKGEMKYTCDVGYVTDLVKCTDLRAQNTEVIMCGPPVVMDICAKNLLDKVFDRSQIWVSLERHMKCGFGKCGHCNVSGKYVCKDGPVFNYSEAKMFKE